MLATRSAPGAPATPVDASLETSVSLGAIVLAAAVPLVFLHIDYQPSVSLALGGTDLAITAADLALLAVAIVALRALVRGGVAPLRAGRPAWIAIVALLSWMTFTTIRAGVGDSDYAFTTHAVSVVKFAEYATLAAATPLLLRTPAEVRLFLRMLVLWGGVAVIVGLGQFFGVNVFEAWRPGRRQPSFLGHHDFAALALCSIGVAFAGILGGKRGRTWFVWIAVVVGAVGTILSGAVAAVGGLVLAAGSSIAVAWRPLRPGFARAAAVVGIVVVAGFGVIALRGGEFDPFLRFLGVGQREQQQGVESYSHRTVLAYIGVRIFRDNPIVGVGWQGSGEPGTFMRYVPDAKRRFPDVAAEAFPAPDRPWGVQDAYVQALADMGVIGLLLFVAPFGAGIWLAASALRRGGDDGARLGLTALVIVTGPIGIWSAEGLVSGIPLSAVTWIGVGLAVTAASQRRSTA